MSNKRILYMVPKLGTLSETFIHREITFLREYIDEIEFEVVSLDTLSILSINPLYILRHIRVIGKEVSAMPFSQKLRALRFSLRAVAIAQRYEHTQYDVIHLQFAYVGTHCARVLSDIWDCPWSVSVHAWDVFVAGNKVAGNPFIAKRLQGVSGICVCNKAAQCALLELGFPSRLIHHSISKTISQSFKNDTKEKGALPQLSLIAVGRLIEKKGFTYLLDALSLLQPKALSICLTIVGTGPLEQELKAKVKAKAIPVVFAGALNNTEVLKAISKSDILICPSIKTDNGDRDGIANVVLEAFSLGTPVIASAVGGLSEVVKNECTGLLVEPKSPQHIAEAVLKYHSNRLLLEHCVTNADRILTDEFDPQTQSLKIRDFLVGILKSHNILNK